MKTKMTNTNANKSTEGERYRKPEFKYGLTISIPPEIGLNELPEPSGNTRTDTEERDGITIKEPEKALSDELWDDKTTVDKHNTENATHRRQIEITKTQTKPVIINQQSEGAQNIIMVIKAHADVKAKIIFVKKTKNKSNTLQTEKIKVIAEKNSRLDITDMYTLDANTTLFDRHETIIKENARIKWVSSLIGGNYRSTETHHKLKEKKGIIENTIIFYGKNKEKFNISTNANHEAENTISNLTARGAVTDESQVLSRGLIKIEKQARNSEGYQKQDSLILDRRAEVDSIPMLEIDCEEVTCSHGSATGHIDEEIKFYLQTRGLSEKEAIQQIIRGYFEPVISTIPLITQHIEEAIR